MANRFWMITSWPRNRARNTGADKRPPSAEAAPTRGSCPAESPRNLFRTYRRILRKTSTIGATRPAADADRPVRYCDALASGSGAFTTTPRYESPLWRPDRRGGGDRPQNLVALHSSRNLWPPPMTDWRRRRAKLNVTFQTQIATMRRRSIMALVSARRPAADAGRQVEYRDESRNEAGVRSRRQFCPHSRSPALS